MNFVFIKDIVFFLNHLLLSEKELQLSRNDELTFEMGFKIKCQKTFLHATIISVCHTTHIMNDGGGVNGRIKKKSAVFLENLR